MGSSVPGSDRTQQPLFGTDGLAQVPAIARPDAIHARLQYKAASTPLRRAVRLGGVGECWERAEVGGRGDKVHANLLNLYHFVPLPCGRAAAADGGHMVSAVTSTVATTPCQPVLHDTMVAAPDAISGGGDGRDEIGCFNTRVEPWLTDHRSPDENQGQ